MKLFLYSLVKNFNRNLVIYYFVSRILVLKQIDLIFYEVWIDFNIFFIFILSNFKFLYFKLPNQIHF